MASKKRDCSGENTAHTLRRCPWCGDDRQYVRYHDTEWGVPVRDDRKLFEFLVLESAQAGLSWLTILRKRDNFRHAFAGFDPEAVARFGQAEIARLLEDPGIIRNRAKIEAAIGNARAFLEIRSGFGSFSDYIWGFVENTPIINRYDRIEQVPASTPLSEKISRDLKARGFRFIGPVIVYSHMQATGMVNDHLFDCFRWRELAGEG